MKFLDKLKKETIKNAKDIVKDVSEDTQENNAMQEISVFKIPTSLEELKATDGADFKDPYKIVALTVAVLSLYPVSSDVCIDMLNYLKGPKPLSNYEIQFLKDRFFNKDYLGVSYFEGATPDNNYEPSEPLTIKVYKTSHSEVLISEGYLQLFVKSGGADSKRGVKLRKKESTGEWFLWEYLLLPDIRKPKSADTWV